MVSWSGLVQQPGAVDDRRADGVNMRLFAGRLLCPGLCFITTVQPEREQFNGSVPMNAKSV